MLFQLFFETERNFKTKQLNLLKLYIDYIEITSALHFYISIKLARKFIKNCDKSSKIAHQVKILSKYGDIFVHVSQVKLLAGKVHPELKILLGGSWPPLKVRGLIWRHISYWGENAYLWELTQNLNYKGF